VTQLYNMITYVVSTDNSYRNVCTYYNQLSFKQSMAIFQSKQTATSGPAVSSK